MAPARIPAGITFGYAGKVLFETSSLITFEPGQATAVVGLNGIGKSTLLKTLAGVISPPQGKLPSFRALYFAEELDLPGNINRHDIDRSLSISTNGSPRLKDLSELLALGQFNTTPWQKLSRGSRQKLRIYFSEAVAIAKRIHLLCYDEPFSGLDFATRDALYGRWFQAAVSEDNKGLHRVVAMHPEEALPPVDQVIAIRTGSLLCFEKGTTWREIKSQL